MSLGTVRELWLLASGEPPLLTYGINRPLKEHTVANSHLAIIACVSLFASLAVSLNAAKDDRGIILPGEPLTKRAGNPFIENSVGLEGGALRTRVRRIWTYVLSGGRDPDVLAPFLQDLDTPVRMEAIRAIGVIGGERAALLLFPVHFSDNPYESRAANEALDWVVNAKLLANQMAMQLETAADEDVLRLLPFVRTYAELEFTDRIVPLLDHPNAQVEIAAIEALESLYGIEPRGSREGRKAKLRSITTPRDRHDAR